MTIRSDHAGEASGTTTKGQEKGESSDGQQYDYLCHTVSSLLTNSFDFSDSSDSSNNASSVIFTMESCSTTIPTLEPGVRFLRSPHEGVAFEGGVCHHVNFIDSKLKDCLFVNCTFEKVTFSNCVLTGVRFHNVVLRNVELEECRFKNTMWADVKKEAEFFCGKDFDQNVFVAQEDQGTQDAGDELDLSRLELGSVLGLPDDEIKMDRKAWRAHAYHRRMEEKWYGGLPDAERLTDGLKEKVQKDASKSGPNDFDVTAQRNLAHHSQSDGSGSACSAPLTLSYSPIDGCTRPDALRPSFDTNAYVKSRFTSDQLKAIQELDDQAGAAAESGGKWNDDGYEKYEDPRGSPKGGGEAKVAALRVLDESNDVPTNKDLYGVSDDDEEQEA